jgi:hypothetical protein
MTIITTVGGSTSNSYVDIAEADAYFLTRVGATAWVDLEDEQKEAYLLTAARQLEVTIWSGTKLHRATQSMSWPRIGIYDFDANIINGIPEKLKQAQLEFAYWNLTEADRFLSDTDVQQLSNFKAGPLDVTLQPGAVFFPPIVEQLMYAIGPGVIQRAPSQSTTYPVRFSI